MRVGPPFPGRWTNNMRCPHYFISAAALIVSLSIVSCTKRKMTQGSSVMEPTIKAGDVITIDLAAYRSGMPARWDVILFDSPTSGSGQWTSRVVGLPGEVIEVTDAGLRINGKAVGLPPHVRITSYKPPRDGLSAVPGPVKYPYTVPPNSYFLMGDNVENALDSRFWGALAESKVIGKVVGK